MAAARSRGLGDRAKASLLSLLILGLLLGIWHLATLRPAAVAGPALTLTPEQIGYAKLMGKDPAAGAAPAAAKSGFPTLGQMAGAAVANLSRPFYDNGPNDKGLGIQLAHSLGRVGLGFVLAMAVAIPLGFVIGMSPLAYKALDPFIQVLKPISPLAWMPLALYTIKDSAISGIFVIFICSIWPMLINTAFGVAGVRRGRRACARDDRRGVRRRDTRCALPVAAEVAAHSTRGATLTMRRCMRHNPRPQ